MAERIWGHEYNASTQAERPGKRESPTQETGRRFVIGQCHLDGGAVKKAASPDRRREAVDQVNPFRVYARRELDGGIQSSPGRIDLLDLAVCKSIPFSTIRNLN